jgi:putative ABC transport system substrate-binding protein
VGVGRGAAFCRTAIRIAGTGLATLSLLGASAASVERIAVVNEASDSGASLFDGLAAHLARNGLGPTRVTVDQRQIDSSSKAAPRAIRALLAEGPFRVVVTSSMGLAQLVQREDSRVPIVFSGAADPVELCLAKSLVHPGMNATGQTTYLPIAAKMIEALRDAYPQLRRWVILVDTTEKDREDEAEPHCGVTPATARRAPGTPCRPGAVVRPEEAPIGELRPMLEYAQREHLQLVFHQICDPADLNGLATYVAPTPSTGVIVPFEYLFYLHRHAVIGTMRRFRLPAIYASARFAEAGGLMALSQMNASPIRIYELVVQVLRGADPGSLPIMVGEGFELWINVGVAKNLGLPPTLRALTRAERLLE